MRERARDKGRLLDIIEYSDNVTNIMTPTDMNRHGISKMRKMEKITSRDTASLATRAGEAVRLFVCIHQK